MFIVSWSGDDTLAHSILVIDKFNRGPGKQTGMARKFFFHKTTLLHRGGMEGNIKRGDKGLDWIRMRIAEEDRRQRLMTGIGLLSDFAVNHVEVNPVPADDPTVWERLIATLLGPEREAGFGGDD